MRNRLFMLQVGEKGFWSIEIEMWNKVFVVQEYVKRKRAPKETCVLYCTAIQTHSLDQRKDQGWRSSRLYSWKERNIGLCRKE